MYAYDLKKFIHSPDIAACVMGNMFTIGEQAVIISQSRRPIQEKIKALKYLRDSHSKEYYCSRTECPIAECEKRKIKLSDLIDRTFAFWKSTLDKCNDNQGVIFASGLKEKGFWIEELRDYRFFTDFKSAYQWLKDEKQEYLKDEDLKDIVTYGAILRIQLNPSKDHNGDYERYDFNNDLEMTDLFGCEIRDWQIVEKRLLTDYYVYVPLPFECGDKIKVEEERSEVYYGVVRFGNEEREKRRYELCRIFDVTDMCTSVYVYDKERKEWGCTDDTSIFGMTFVTDEEWRDRGLPECPEEIIKKE